jgi:hypothetical protein
VSTLVVDGLMKLKEVPFENVIVEMLRQFEQDGIIAIAEGGNRVRSTGHISRSPKVE